MLLIFGIVLMIVGGLMVFINYRNRRNPEETKVYKRGVEYAEAYTKPFKCKIVGCSSGLAGTYTTIQVLAEGTDTYRVRYGCKENDIGKVRIYYRHKENPFDFVPDYLVYNADVKYLRRRWLFGMIGGCVVILLGIMVITFGI